MEKVKVKSEYAPERCEICHQSDCFDSSTGSCSRCASINLSEIDLTAQVVDILVTPNIKIRESVLSDVHFYFHQPVVLMCFVVFGLIGTIYLFLYLLFNFPIWEIDPVLTRFSIFILLSPIFIILLTLLEIVFKSWRNNYSFNLTKKTFLIRITEKGLHYSSGETSFNLPWNHFKGAYETPYHIIICTKSKPSFKFPKSLISDIDSKKIRNLFKVKFGNRAKLM
jgi:hypothetical protein